MPTLKTYQKPEEALIDAGYLCSLGIEAVVGEISAHGASLAGIVESPPTLEVPEAQLEQATSYLAQRTDVPSVAARSDATVRRDRAFWRLTLFWGGFMWISCSLAPEVMKVHRGGSLNYSSLIIGAVVWALGGLVFGGLMRPDASHDDAPPNKPNKTDAGNGLNGICRVIDTSRSPSPDPKR